MHSGISQFCRKRGGGGTLSSPSTTDCRPCDGPATDIHSLKEELLTHVFQLLVITLLKTDSSKNRIKLGSVYFFMDLSLIKPLVFGRRRLEVFLSYEWIRRVFLLFVGDLLLFLRVHFESIVMGPFRLGSAREISARTPHYYFTFQATIHGMMPLKKDVRLAQLWLQSTQICLATLVFILLIPYFLIQFPPLNSFLHWIVSAHLCTVTFGLMYCDLWSQYINVRKLFKGGNY